jgi:hypothetical protein
MITQERIEKFRRWNPELTDEEIIARLTAQDEAKARNEMANKKFNDVVEQIFCLAKDSELYLYGFFDAMEKAKTKMLMCAKIILPSHSEQEKYL